MLVFLVWLCRNATIFYGVCMPGYLTVVLVTWALLEHDGASAALAVLASPLVVLIGTLFAWLLLVISPLGLILMLPYSAVLLILSLALRGQALRLASGLSAMALLVAAFYFVDYDASYGPESFEGAAFVVAFACGWLAGKRPPLSEQEPMDPFSSFACYFGGLMLAASVCLVPLLVLMEPT